MLTMLTANGTFRLLTMLPSQQCSPKEYDEPTDKHPPYVKHVSNALDQTLTDRSRTVFAVA